MVQGVLRGPCTAAARASGTPPEGTAGGACASTIQSTARAAPRTSLPTMKLPALLLQECRDGHHSGAQFEWREP